MYNRYSLLLLFLVAFFGACHSPSAEERAAQAAKSYYDQLAEGYIEGFLEGRADADSLPSDYMEQMVTVHRQYLADMQRKHGGLSHVSISPNVARRDTTLHLTYAFLLLSFCDSTQEEIVVPMTERDGEWRMR